MKTRLIFIISFLVFLTELCTAQNIKTRNGFQIRTGVNLALWLSQSEIRGIEREQYIMESDIENIVSMGFDHVRLPIDEVQFWDDNEIQKADAFKLMHNAIKWSMDLIAKLVESLRKSEPERTIVIGSNNWQGTETFPALKVPENDKNIILSFHFYRPFGFTHYKAPWTQMNSYNGPVNYPGEVITKKDQKDYSDEYFKNISWAIGYWDKSRMLDDINSAIMVAKKLNLPLYCGEFSVYHTAPKDAAIRWYRDVTDIFKENNIAFCHWEYKDDFPIVDKNLKPLQPLVDILTK